MKLVNYKNLNNIEILRLCYLSESKRLEKDIKYGDFAAFEDSGKFFGWTDKSNIKVYTWTCEHKIDGAYYPKYRAYKYSGLSDRVKNKIARMMDQAKQKETVMRKMEDENPVILFSFDMQPKYKSVEGRDDVYRNLQDGALHVIKDTDILARKYWETTYDRIYDFRKSCIDEANPSDDSALQREFDIAWEKAESLKSKGKYIAFILNDISISAILAWNSWYDSDKDGIVMEDIVIHQKAKDKYLHVGDRRDDSPCWYLLIVVKSEDIVPENKEKIYKELQAKLDYFMSA